MPSFTKPYQKLKYIFSQYFSENTEKIYLAITDLYLVNNLRFNTYFEYNVSFLIFQYNPNRYFAHFLSQKISKVI